MTPDAYCQQKAAASGSSFYYSFLFLPPERRAAITAFYAWCREVDDIADDCHEPDVARAKLAWWRQETAALFQGTPNHPVTRALLPAVSAYGLDLGLMNEILDGMEMDAWKSRYATAEELEAYCHKVAGVVGILSARIFGHTRPATLEYAHQLGLAFQYINIIRDVGEDARRQRIYLPVEDLARFHVPAADLLAGRSSPQFEALMAFEATRARAHLAAAMAALPAEDRRAQRPGLIMAAIYATLLDEIERTGFAVLNQRISLTPLRKLWIAWKTWIRA